MEEVELERSIQQSLSPEEYTRLIRDLQGAVRAFKVIGDVAPDLFRKLVSAGNRAATSQNAERTAQGAIEQLIAELAPRGKRSRGDQQDLRVPTDPIRLVSKSAR